MKNLKKFYLNFIYYKEWSIYIKINHFFWKLKNYDRLESDYTNVLMYVTDNTLSKSNYILNDVKSVIDSELDKYYNDIFKSDIQDIIDNDGFMSDIQEYINDF